jgi:SNF2 family DNA or RNA helicase
MKYKWRTKPYAHQVRAVKKLLSNGFGGALLMEPRTGKTKTTIDYLSILALAGKIDRAVVIAPNRVLGVWVDEFLRHSPARVEIQVWDKDGRKRGDPRPPTPGYDLSVLVINYDAFGTPGRKTPSGRRSKATGRFKVRKQVAGWIAQKPCAGVLDESHKIKSPSGKSANMIVSMGPMFTHRVILTGTPITKAKRAHDIYMQWKFLNPHRFEDLPTLADFKDHYGRWTNAGGFPKWLGGKNMAELARRMQEDGVVVKREDCFDLPPRDVQIIPVDLDASADPYDQMAEEMVAQLKSGEIAEASIPIVQTLRLAQITSGMVTIDAEHDYEGNEIKPKRVVRIGTEKLRVLEELLPDIKENEEKVVICARFKPDLDAISELARNMGFRVFTLRGGMKREESDAAVREFRKYDDAAVFVMQPAAGSLGIDLSTASRMIWYSLTQSWVDYTQSCDRIALSRTSTTFTYLLAKGTVDEVLYNVLQEDGDVAKAILSNPDSLLRV